MATCDTYFGTVTGVYTQVMSRDDAVPVDQKEATPKIPEHTQRMGSNRRFDVDWESFCHGIAPACADAFFQTLFG